MAEYLLKGGKMLAKTCPDCSSPLFEYKGETFCAVCREDQINQQKSEEIEKNNEKPANPSFSAKKPESGRENPGDSLEDMFALTIKTLLVQAREEHDTRRVLDLMKAIKIAAEGYAIFTYGYESLESS